MVSTLLVVACDDEATFAAESHQWVRRPLRVYSLGSRSSQAAMDLWNREAKCALFREQEPDERADVVIEYDAPPDSDCGRRCDPNQHIACTCFEPNLWRWRIYYPSPSTIDVDMWVIAHELGHVLGLAHDIGRTNIVTRPDAHMGPREHRPLLVSNKDAIAVRQRYCEVR